MAMQHQLYTHSSEHYWGIGLYFPAIPIFIVCLLFDNISCLLCRRIINDSLRTDVSLLYPPYMISLGTYFGIWFVKKCFESDLCQKMRSNFSACFKMLAINYWILLIFTSQPKNGFVVNYFCVMHILRKSLGSGAC